jgi:uncharacterized protein YegP (UPF0339 family)
MTRSEQVAHAVGVLRKARATPSPLSEAAALTFVVYEDNSGGYLWAIIAHGGETLARSASFGSYEEAQQAARTVYDGASSARFEDRSSDTGPVDLPARRPVDLPARRPVDLPARRDAATARDVLDAERWLDEGGSFSSDAVSR